MITCPSHRLQWGGLIPNVLIADVCRHQIAQPPQLSRPPTLPRVSGPDATEFDVAVIGGGIAGAAAAWALAPDLRVVVLEAESGLSYHTTGRSAAVLTESYEAEPIRELTGRSRSILTTEFADVSGLLTKRGVFWIVSIGQDTVALPAEGQRLVAVAQERDAGEVGADGEDERLAGYQDRRHPGPRGDLVERGVERGQPGRAERRRPRVVEAVVEGEER